MYIAVNPEKMEVLYKDPSPYPLCNLCWLECGDSDYTIFPVDTLSSFKGFTDADLETLYQSLTGQAVPKEIQKRTFLVRVLIDLVDRLPFTELNAFQLDLQCKYAETATSGKRFQYVARSTSPQPVSKDWEPSAMSIKADPEREKLVVLGKLSLPVVTPPQKVTTKKPATAAPKCVPARKPANPFAKPGGASKTPAGSVTASPELANEVGEAVWLAAGSPSQKVGVLMLRQQIIKKLVDQGVEKQAAQTAATEFCSSKIKKLATA